MHWLYKAALVKPKKISLCAKFWTDWIEYLEVALFDDFFAIV